MLVSLKEISKYVDIKDLTPEEIASRLTFAGIEVEEIKRSAEATNLVIGEVIDCKNHPNSDHLHVCKVDVGDEILDIVCGAPNVRKGLKVIVAKVGAILSGNKEIKRGEIRGEISNGMLCALNELGVDPKYLRKEQIEGIEELPSDAKVGNTNVLSYLGLDDVILDLSLLANRSDCYALYNVAREIGALFDRKVNIPTFNEEHTFEDNEFKISSLTTKCPSFYGKIVKNIKIKESPKWLKDVLQSEGIRSIDNVVDVANYVMLLTGQPLHTYDYDKLLSKELIVKDDIDEDFIALDNQTYHIKPGDLCVTSNNKTMCLAGIMGGENSEISSESKNIVIEVANFNFASIRKTSSRLGLSSDSSLRFSKGINKNQSEDVLNLTIHLLKEVSDEPSSLEISNIIKYDTINHEPKNISCSLDYINNRLGSSFTYEEVKDVLTKLNFKFVNEDLSSNNFEVIVPSYRIDVEGKADLSEEVIRYKGFDYIKTSYPIMETTLGSYSSSREKEKIIEDYLLTNSLYEVLTYTLINEKDNSMYNYFNKVGNGLVISNPLSEDHKYIRKNILTSLLRTMEYNLNHKESDFGIFEISNVYNENDKDEIHLGIILEGNKLKQDNIVDHPYSYYDLKGLFEGITSLFNIDSNRLKYKRLEENNKEFHPGRSAYIYLDGKLLAVLGEVHPLKRNEFSLKKENVLLLEMNLSLLFNTRSANNKFNEISKYPSVRRDFAFIISKDLDYILIRNELKKASSLIKSISLFDIYEGEHIKEGYVSLALSLTYEAFDHTLKEDEINTLDNKIKEILLSKFKVEFRG